MIATAMNTRPQEALSYRDLARQQAHISRRINLNALPRLKALVESADATEVGSAAGIEAGGIEAGGIEVEEGFEVALRFSIDARGFSRVEGELNGRIALQCNGCAETLGYPLTLTIGCVIVETEAIADGLVEDSSGERMVAEDVLVAGGAEVTLTQIVEDEILLNLPERLCTSEPCERAPELAYPAFGVHQAESLTDSDSEGEDGNDDNPFSILADLKIGDGQQNEQ
jgi:uncharacterized metal-binding protein YceD (DUF177 family)